MNITSIVDVIIVLVIALWALNGFKRGFIKQGVMTIGTLIMFILAFLLKNPIAEFLSLYLPFFKFNGLLGAPVLNILFYQLVAFLIVVVVLEVILNVLIKISGILETLLKFTIILGLPSKILGLILGAIEGFIVVYVVLFFISQPVFNLGLMQDSKLTPMVLQKVPVLSNITGGMVDTFTDIYDLMDHYSTSSDSDAYSREAIKVLLDHKIVSVSYIDKLIEKEKISVEGINSVLNAYR